MTHVCRYLRISRQAWYQHFQRARQHQAFEDRVLEHVLRLRIRHPRLGTRKLHYLLDEQQIHVGRDKLFALLKRHRLLVHPKRSYHKTTLSHHRFYRHPNLLKEGVVAEKPEQVWVADITYLPTKSCETYLSLVTDACSRKIVGYSLGTDMKTQTVSKAFKSALRQRQCTSALIHHSDRGVQYCSAEYQKIHERYGVQCSMTDGYDCYQNALAERVNGILKQEYLTQKPKDLEEARVMVKEAVMLYNQQRPHHSLKYKTPDEVHRAL